MQSEGLTANNAQDENQKKTLYIKKLKNLSTNPFKKELHDLFNNPSTYLTEPKVINDKCIVGKKATGPRYDENNNLITFSVVGKLNLFDKKKKRQYRNWVRSLSQAKDKDGIFSEKKLLNLTTSKDKKVEIISKLFDYNEKLIKSNKSKENCYLKTVPNEVRFRLKCQENMVKLRKSYEMENTKIIENIKKDYASRNAFKKTKFNKKKPLLIETSNLFLMKNEAKSYVNTSTINQDLTEQNNWIIALRRPNNFQGKRDAFIPYGREDNIRWALLKENLPFKKETIADPNWKKDEFCPNKSNIFNYSNSLSPDESYYRTTRTIYRYNSYQNKAKKLADLEIKGKSLFEIEKEHFKSLKGNFNYFLPKTDESNEDCMKDITFIESYKDKCKYKPTFKN